MTNWKVIESLIKTTFLRKSKKQVPKFLAFHQFQKILIYFFDFFFFFSFYISIACYFYYHSAKKQKQKPNVYFYCLIMSLTATSSNKNQKPKKKSKLFKSKTNKIELCFDGGAVDFLFSFFFFGMFNVCDIEIKKNIQHSTKHRRNAAIKTQTLCCMYKCAITSWKCQKCSDRWCLTIETRQ